MGADRTPAASGRQASPPYGMPTSFHAVWQPACGSCRHESSAGRPSIPAAMSETILSAAAQPAAGSDGTHSRPPPPSYEQATAGSPRLPPARPTTSIEAFAFSQLLSVKHSRANQIALHCAAISIVHSMCSGESHPLGFTSKQLYFPNSERFMDTLVYPTFFFIFFPT
jgi:hypothetical protein